ATSPLTCPWLPRFVAENEHRDDAKQERYPHSQTTMTTKSNLVAPGVPILGQPEPTPYPLAGHVLGFTLSPDDVADVHRSAIQQGLPPDAGFVLLWQRCSMAVARLEAQVRDLNDRVKALEQLESREVITDAAGPLAVAVLPLAQLVYRRHAAGCCLHVVLDDGNVDDDSVD